MDSNVRRAIALVQLIQDGRVARRGTACLVGKHLALTALHVIADRTSPPTLLQGEIWLTFPTDHRAGGRPHTHSTTARVLDGEWDAREDWVLLAVDTPPPAKWLRLAELAPNGHDEWETYGYPDAQPDDGMVCRGTVANDAGTLDGVRVQQLFCYEAAAGNGMPVSGLSGAPVLVDAFVVGVLRWALLTSQIEPHTGTRINVAGTIYACPASSVAASSPRYFPKRLPTASSRQLSTRNIPLAKSLGYLIMAVVFSLIASLSALTLAQIFLDWNFSSNEIAMIFLTVLSITFYGARLRSRRLPRNTDERT
jgi:hypothetical protein